MKRRETELPNGILRRKQNWEKGTDDNDRSLNNAGQGNSMEVEVDVSHLDKGCQSRRKFWCLEWWKRNLSWELDKWKKGGARTREDYKEFIQRWFANGQYDILFLEMMEEIEEVFPGGTPYQCIAQEELTDYLMEEMYRELKGETLGN